MANNKPIGVAYSDPQLDSFQVGEANAPIAITSAGVLNGAYATTSAPSGDTRLNYNKLTFTSTGSGETLRAFSVVTGAAAATAGTINGAHISLEVDGASATISGAANAIRATLGGTDATPGGTLAVIQLDTNYTVNATLPATASFIRVTDSGSNTGEIPLLMNIATAPAATIAPTATSVTTVSKAIKVMIGGTVYYIPAYATFA
jgi:hypothetical protein